MNNPTEKLKLFSIDDIRFLMNKVLPTKSVAIVGNGGLTAKELERVKRSDLVIRFNDYGNRSVFGSDYYRCDILFTTFDCFDKNKPAMVVAGIPFPFKAKRIYQKFAELYPNAYPRMVNPFMCMEMCHELGIESLGYEHPFPSIGFTCLWMIYQQLKFKLGPFPDFYVCGFNWYFDEVTQLFQKHHLSRENYPSHWNHNYPKELRWIMEHLRGDKRFEFGETQKRLFEIADSQIIAN